MALGTYVVMLALGLSEHPGLLARERAALTPG